MSFHVHINKHSQTDLWVDLSSSVEQEKQGMYSVVVALSKKKGSKLMKKPRQRGQRNYSWEYEKSLDNYGMYNKIRL